MESDMATATSAALGMAVIAICSAGSVLAQTTATGMSGIPTPSDVTPDARASAVIRAIEQEGAPAGALPVDVRDLARARTAGELQTAARGAPARVERIEIDDMVRMDAHARARTARGQNESADRTKGAAVTRLDDADRYREQARHAAARKRRDATATVGSDPAARGGQSKAGIAWSTPGEQRDYRTAIESHDATR